MNRLNLNTKGGEFYLKGTTQEYRGYYNVTDGRYYSGRSISEESIELELIQFDVVSYTVAAEAEQPKSITPFLPSPTEEDYKRGWFVRYFARQANIRESRYIEISEMEYNEVVGSQKPFYTAVKLRWKISGPPNDILDATTGAIMEPGVSNTNVRSIRFLGEEHLWLQFRLQDKFEFYKGTRPAYFGPPLQSDGMRLSHTSKDFEQNPGVST